MKRFTDAECEEIVNLLSDVVAQCPFLESYDGCINMETRHRSYDIHVDRTLRIKNPHSVKGDSGRTRNSYGRADAPTVGIVAFQKMTTIKWAMKWWDLNGRDRHGDMDGRMAVKDKMFLAPFDFSESFGVNVLSKLKIKGNMYNYNSFKADYTNDRHTMDSMKNSMRNLYFVGTRNTLLGFHYLNNTVLLRYEAIRNLLKNNDREDVVTALKNLFTYFDRINQCHQQMTTKYLEDTTSKKCLDRFMSGFASANSTLNRDLERKFRNNKSKTNTPALIDMIGSHVQTCVKQYFNKTVWGANDDYSYKALIEDILKSEDARSRKLIDKSFQDGIKYGLKLEMYGWSLSTKSKTKSYHGHVWWEKEVEIIPDQIIKGNKRYRIPEKKRRWKITKLLVNQQGEMHAEGKHPNVSGGGVCMGDLKIDMKGTDAKLRDSLERAETLLDIINFDSAFDNTGASEISKSGEVLEVMDENQVGSLEQRSVRQTKGVSRFSDFQSAQDDDEPEETLEPEEDVVEPEQQEVVNPDTGEVAGYVVTAPELDPESIDRYRTGNRTTDFGSADEVVETAASHSSLDTNFGTTIDGIVQMTEHISSPLIITSLGEDELQTIHTELQQAGLSLGDANLI